MRDTSAPVDPLFLSFQLALAGRYSIDREIGRGGMGVVYLAREVHLDRPVAIKLLPPDRSIDPNLRERFLREARLAAKLSHPNIIPIHAVDETGDFVYFVMAYVDGETLAHRVRTRGPLPSSEGSRVLREVAWALAYAHAQDVVHRDVKPDNILLESATGRVLVADFGIAAAAGEVGTDTGVSGTPEFMSPEQALGGQIDARSDLYGLGATAFFALSGRLPFEGRSPTEILAKQVTEPAPPLASLGISVPRKLAALVDRCLAKEPQHRPTDAQALAEQLGVALEQRKEVPVALRAFVKRNARLDGGGTLIGLASLLSVSTVTAFYFSSVASGFVSLLVGATTLPFTYLVLSARNLMRHGFGHTDLAAAFKSAATESREELAVGTQHELSTVERWLPRLAKVGVSFMGLGAAATVFGYPRYSNLGTIVLFFSAMATTFTTIGHLTLTQRRRDVDTDFWAKIWLGRIGKSAFKVARKLLGKQTFAAANTHRATELSLGTAAEQLYESLPKETQRELADLPPTLKRLQQDAQALRRHYEALQEALADAGDAASSERYADVRDARDEMHAKLGETVTALETIRLNLLRLHAGSATVEGLTTHLGLAADVSEEVERLIASHKEVDEIMRFPRAVAPTPV
jgi:eukaryotic-like serine/threonine-protein kinase